MPQTKQRHKEYMRDWRKDKHQICVDGFTNQEFAELSKYKEQTGLNWHDFLLLYTGVPKDLVYYDRLEDGVWMTYKGLFNGFILETADSISVDDLLRIKDKKYEVKTRKEKHIANQFYSYVCKVEEVKTE